MIEDCLRYSEKPVCVALANGDLRLVIEPSLGDLVEGVNLQTHLVASDNKQLLEEEVELVLGAVVTVESTTCVKTPLKEAGGRQGDGFGGLIDFHVSIMRHFDPKAKGCKPSLVDG